jgi:hypothetical protein
MMLHQPGCLTQHGPADTFWLYHLRLGAHQLTWLQAIVHEGPKPGRVLLVKPGGRQVGGDVLEYDPGFEWRPASTTSG